MNKNILLGIIGVASIAIVGVLVFLSPEKPNSLPKQQSPQQQISQKQIDIHMSPAESKSSDVEKKTKTKKPKQKIDPSIKAATIDHYNKYLLQLIDNRPNNKNITLTKNDYTFIVGKIDGNQFSLRTPKTILNHPNIKLKITNLETQKSKIIDAAFLSEAATLPKGSTFRMNINFENLDDIKTDINFPSTGLPPFPNTQLSN